MTQLVSENTKGSLMGEIRVFTAELIWQILTSCSGFFYVPANVENI